MAANRKLPFGYEMRGGRVKDHPAEAETVRWIYRQYLAGLSYEKLTRELQRQAVPYLAGKAWNKNMVARILSDGRYLGTEQFPQVIEPRLYQAVREILPAKASVRKKSETAGAVQRLAVCGACGAKVSRDPYRHGKERWYCPDCGAISTKATDLRLERGVRNILERLKCAPETVTLRTSPGKAAAEEREAEFRELLDTPDFDEALAEQMALDLAAARFNALGTEDYEAMRTRYILENAREEDAGPDLLQQIAEAVLVHPDGKVSLRLKNKQIIDEE